ncbi:MAG: hypothetical protein IPN77_33675 [Sandaracinaceae bacterium]|nr:hypothetical protein [Sandaracinaceae bacterium]
MVVAICIQGPADGGRNNYPVRYPRLLSMGGGCIDLALLRGLMLDIVDCVAKLGPLESHRSERRGKSQGPEETVQHPEGVPHLAESCVVVTVQNDC